MAPNERRMAIYQALCARRQDTVDNLAHEFGVSEKTIRRDVEELMCSFPIETVRGRYGGGVKVADWYHHPHRNILSQEQQTVLIQLLDKADESQQKVLRELLAASGTPVA